MRITSFCVKKYRSIEDSGKIKIDENLTTFVGINESGKTNVLRALRKINNMSDTTFTKLTENPMWHFGKFSLDEIFITATFKLNNDEKEQIKKISGIVLEEIKFSKKNSMELICYFEPNLEQAMASYMSPIASLIRGIVPSQDQAERKQALMNAFEAIKNKEDGAENNTDQSQNLEKIETGVQNFKTVLHTMPDSMLGIQEVDALLNKVDEAIQSLHAAKNYLINKLPRFIYFENTGIIDSRIYLPAFVERLKTKNLNEADRTAKALLDLGNLDPQELLRLSKEDGDRDKVVQNKDELDLILSLASKKVSEQIDNIWTSNDHKIEFRVQGNDFRVWVVNKNDGTKLQLEERSRGYQWYFSFYTVFNVESEQGHKDAIILLDEPALFLHAKAQEDFLNRVLPSLMTKNQIIYTTHSPFMINLTKPDSIHTVTLKENDVLGTKQKVSHISNENWDSDKGALFPLQSALHYTMAQSMFIGRKNLIVEGVTDFWLLSSASNLLEAAGKIHLNKDFVFVPVGGGTKSTLFAITYKSQGLDVAVLLDGDREGSTASEQIVKNKILREKNVSMLNEIFDKKRNMSIEDIFQEEYYLRFVYEAYKNELSEKGISKVVLTSQDPMIVKRIEDFFNKNGLEFNKSRPDRLILTELGCSGIESLHSETIARFEKIFAKVNKMLN